MTLPIYNRCGFQIRRKFSWRLYLLTIPVLIPDKSILTVAAEDCQPLKISFVYTEGAICPPFSVYGYEGFQIMEKFGWRPH